MRPYKFLITLVAIALFGAGFAYLIAPAPETPRPQTAVLVSDAGAESATVETPQTIPSSSSYVSKTSDGTSEKTAPEQTYLIPVVSDTTVLHAMEAYRTVNGDFSFSVREFSGLGFFVEDIGGLKNRDGFYWTLFINNTLSEKGASMAEVSPGDIVEWRYQKGI